VISKNRAKLSGSRILGLSGGENWAEQAALFVHRNLAVAQLRCRRLRNCADLSDGLLSRFPNQSLLGIDANDRPDLSHDPD
jgi:hypothetical protein